MVLFNFLLPFLIINGVLAGNEDEVKEKFEFSLAFLDLYKSVFYFERTAGFPLMKRMDPLELPQSVDTYTCDLKDNKDSGDQSYELVMQKVLLPGMTYYTRLLLKYKDGEKEYDIPLAKYLDFINYPSNHVNTNSEQYVTSVTQLYVDKWSTPTNLEVVVQGTFTKNTEGNTHVQSVTHKIVFNKQDNAATIELTSNPKMIMDGGVNTIHEKIGEIKKIEKLCSKKI